MLAVEKDPLIVNGHQAKIIAAKTVWCEAARLLLISEPRVTLDSGFAQSPINGVTFRKLFPSWIEKSLPKDGSDFTDAQIGQVFINAGYTAISLYKKVQSIVQKRNPNTYMESKARNSNDFIMHLWSCTTVSLNEDSCYQMCDWWSIAGAALLESIVIPLNCPSLLDKEIG